MILRRNRIGLPIDPNGDLNLPELPPQPARTITTYMSQIDSYEIFARIIHTFFLDKSKRTGEPRRRNVENENESRGGPFKGDIGDSSRPGPFSHDAWRLSACASSSSSRVSLSCSHPDLMLVEDNQPPTQSMEFRCASPSTDTFPRAGTV
jgi:hypothetical protein